MIPPDVAVRLDCTALLQLYHTADSTCCLFAAVCHLLLQQYKWHEPSREAIEGAFDTLLQVGNAVPR
jgi:hypothetical protein